MIQDIEPYALSLEYAAHQPRLGDYVVVYHNHELYISSTDPLELPSVGMLEKQQVSQLIFLFELADKRWFLWTGAQDLLLDGCFWQSDSLLRRATPSWAAFGAMVGEHLAQWYQTNRYCGSCGEPTSPADDERALVCKACGSRIYPRIVPAVICAVVDKDNDSIVVTRYPGRRLSSYALIAGFIEVGETAEQAVKREVMEEVGLSVEGIRYVASQPWGRDCDLLLGFYCEVAGSRTIQVEHNELADAYWLSRDQMKPLADTSSLTADMLERFRTGRL